MNDIKKILAGFKKEDFKKRVNLHIHSTCSDGQLEPKEIVEKALENNLEYISITDHNSLVAYSTITPEDLKGLNLITGIEFDCWYKSNFMHILGYGFDPDNDNIRKFCARRKRDTHLDIARFFTSRQAEDVIGAIKDAGGAAILAHPACCWNRNPEKMIKELMDFFELDGIEVYYRYHRLSKIIKFHDEKKFEKIVNKYKLLATGGTDCHDRNLATL